MLLGVSGFHYFANEKRHLAKREDHMFTRPKLNLITTVMPYEIIARLAIAVGIGAIAMFYYFRNNTPEKCYSYNDIQSGYDTAPQPSRHDSGQNNEVLCAICQLENFCAPVRELSCGHSFHVKCIEKWSKVKKDCPICRKAFI